METEVDVIKFARKAIKTAYKNIKRIETPEDLPDYYGYYSILCNRPVLKGAKKRKGAEPVRYKDLYVWRDGATDIKNTIASTYLFRNAANRRDGTKPNSMKIVQQPLEVFKNLSHNFTEVGDGVNGYENGIDITEARWDGYEFYLVSIETEQLANLYGQIANDTIGFPPLNLQRKK